MGVDVPHDPDPNYELTTDNVKKIMAIYMRFRYTSFKVIQKKITAKDIVMYFKLVNRFCFKNGTQINFLEKKYMFCPLKSLYHV